MYSFKKKFLYIIFILVFLFSIIPSITLGVDNVPNQVFSGTTSANAKLINLQYNDVMNANTASKDDIWETGALELLKGYGDRNFGLNDLLTVEQAIAISYNMAGREAEAQLAAEALDLERDNKKELAPRMWSDGYIQLALNDGLISSDDYDDAFASDQSNLDSTDFNRYSPVTREDMAYYIARVLGINPVNSQTHLFNSFNDWKQTNPHRIPYIESLLQNRIMNGDVYGNFYPKGTVTRQQVAQIIKNAEPLIFPKIGMEKSRGTIESISSYTDRTNGRNTLVRFYNIRKSNGLLEQFRFLYPETEESVNEITGSIINAESTGTIVNESCVLKNETVLQEGQEIAYVTQNGKVLYVTVLSFSKKTDYLLGRILSVDEPESKITGEILLEVPFSDVRMLEKSDLNNLDLEGNVESLSVSKDALIYIDFVKKTLKEVEPQSLMLLTIENDLVTAMEKVNLELLHESGVVSGILEENNTVLGYVTLYFYDGSGTSLQKKEGLSAYRTYSYLNIKNVEVFKNGSFALIEDLNPGDSVFLKLDETGSITRISGSGNFYPIYGKVRAKGSNTLQIEKQDGTVTQLPIPDNTPIFKNRKRIGWDEIKNSDEIRVLLQTTGNHVVIGEVTIVKQSFKINGIYKAQLNYYDAFENNLIISGVQYFKDGLWRQDQVKGITKFNISNDYNPVIQKGASGIVYFATAMNRMGNETIVHLKIENDNLKTDVLNDTIIEALPGRGSISLLNDSRKLIYDDNTIIVKNQMLMEANQVKSRDEAYFAVSGLTDGSLETDILWIKEPISDTGLTLLRGRISDVKDLSSLTLKSFSWFNSPDWEFMNVQKTLTIDPEVTRFFDDEGRADLSQLDNGREHDYINRTVYVLSQEGNAMLVSTAPYGDVVIKGRISQLQGLGKDSFGHIVTKPSAITVSDAKLFNREIWLWDNQQAMDLDLLGNTVIIRNGKISESVELEEGDRITVIRSTVGQSAFVIIAESY